MANVDSSGTLRQLSPTASSRSPSDLRRALLADQSDSWDRYEGRLEDFVAAGLFRLDELPGQVDRPKTACKYGPDGEFTNSKERACVPGGRSIRLTSKKRAMAYVAISWAERERRVDEEERRRSEVAAAESRELIELMLESARQDMALPDHQLVAKCRAKLSARIRSHEEALRALVRVVQPKVPNLRLVHCTGRGTT